MTRVRALGAAVVAVIAVGCIRTRSEVDVKPVAINLNISGRLELVITDARRQEEAITGTKAKRTVRPEDIGLPPAASPGSPGPGAMRMRDGSGFRLQLVSEVFAAEGDRQAALIQQMTARHGAVQALLDARLAGESHDGSLVAKGALSAAQKAVLEAENADRAELYKLESAKKTTPVDQVALGYYLARLGHVNKGTWVERFDKAANKWEWFQWDR